jgi:sporulation protein YlmC with PRC-barrel domain
MEKYLNKFDDLHINMRVKKVSEVMGMKVYTDAGDFFGEIEEANLSENKIAGWRIRVGGSVISLIGGARGVIIPHQFVRAISDIFIINKSALPSSDSDIEEVPEDLI